MVLKKLRREHDMFDIIKNKRYFFALSIVLLLVGFAFYFVNGIRLDIQFQGGTIIQMEIGDEDIDLEKAANIAEATVNKEVDAQKSQTIDVEAGDKMINMLVLNISNAEDTLTAEEQTKLIDAMRKEFNLPENAEISVNSVEPFIGKEMLSRGIRAVVWASLLIVLYIWWRFRSMGLSAGLMAIVALLHDALIVFATYIVFKIPLDDGFIAVILTILGYSINDTIVIYDRIRENMKTMRKVPIGEVVNRSILQSMSRSINTSVATFMSMVVVYIFAVVYNIESVRDFSLPLLTGIISGCYSTIFIAGPLWVLWKEYQTKRKVA